MSCPLWAANLVPLRLERSESAASLEHLLPLRPFRLNCKKSLLIFNYALTFLNSIITLAFFPQLIHIIYLMLPLYLPLH